MSGNPNKIIAYNYFGGKFTWLEFLYSHFPEDFTHLIDVFGGSFVVSLNYRRNVIKTANDLYSEIPNFFRILRDHEEELTRLLLLTPVSHKEYRDCWEKSDDPIEQARRFYVRVRQSFFGLGVQRWNKGWHMAKKKHYAKGGETVSRWNNAIEKLHEVAEVIRVNFQITDFDYNTVIDKTDFNKAFFYCDPPYPKQVRSGHTDYAHEFSNEQHEALAAKLREIKGLDMVSSYESEFYDELYSGWFKVLSPIKRNSIRSSKDVQEAIYMNYTPPGPGGLFSNKEFYDNELHTAGGSASKSNRRKTV